jgi:hypothetical protein
MAATVHALHNFSLPFFIGREGENPRIFTNCTTAAKGFSIFYLIFLRLVNSNQENNN